MSDAQARPAKRARLSDHDSSPPSRQDRSLNASSAASSSSSNLQHHPEIWFEDGNIVLIARGIAFRIYRGLLAAQSTVISDMFVSSTSSPDEAYDRCPVVHLSDSPSDLAHLLRVLLPKTQINYHPTKDDLMPTFDEVSAVIHLAHKYHIPQVQTQALSSLQEYDFTSSFAVFSSAPPDPKITINPVHAIAAVNLARLTDTPSMLPLALYQCTSLGNVLLDGLTRADGTIEHLSDADLRRCLDARVALVKKRFIFMSRLFGSGPSAGCRIRRCALRLTDLHITSMRSRGVMRVEEEGELERGLLRDWEPFVRSFAGGREPLCEPCIEMLVERVGIGRKRLWNRLPKIFGIEVPGWGEPGVEPDSGDDDDEDEQQ